MPGLAGFLQGFTDTIGTARKAQAQEAEDAMKRDQDLFHMVIEHSEDPSGKQQAAALQGLADMAGGKYRPGGLARYLGTPGRIPINPQVSALSDLIRGGGGGGAGAPGATGAGTPPPPTAPAGETAAMPPKPVTAGGGPGSSAVVGSPGGPTSAAEAPVTGTATLPPIPTIAPPSGSPAASPEVAPPAPKPVAAPAPTQPPAAGAVGGPPPAAPVTAPTATGAQAEDPFAGIAPPLQPGQIGYTPQQTADIAARRQAATPAAQWRAKYQSGYDAALAAGKSHEDAQSEALLVAGTPKEFQALPSTITIGPDGNLYQVNRSFDATTGRTTSSQGLPYATANPGNPNELEAVMGALGYARPGLSSAQNWNLLSPEDKAIVVNKVNAMKAQEAGAVTGARGAAAPFTITNPDLSTTRHLPAAPPPAVVGGPGAGGPPPPLTATPTAPTKPVVAGGGVGGPPPPMPKGPVGSNPQHPEAPMAVGPQQATPQGVPSATPVSGGTNVQTKPPTAVDVASLAYRGTTGAQYLDTSQLSGEQRTMAIRQATEAGIRPLNTQQAGAMQALQTARANIEAYTKQLMPFLAKDPAGRIKTSLNNFIGKWTQANPILAALPAEWTTSIEALKGTAGTIRVTFPEIGKALEGLPEMTDDADTAFTKLQDVVGMFDRAENAVLPPPPQVLDAQRTGKLQPGHAWMVDAGPGSGQEWALMPSGAFRRLNK